MYMFFFLSILSLFFIVGRSLIFNFATWQARQLHMPSLHNVVLMSQWTWMNLPKQTRRDEKLPLSVYVLEDEECVFELA